MRRPADVTGDDAEGVAAAHEVAERWAAVGLGGAFLARDLRTGRAFGFDVDRAMPLASVVKLPVALVVLDEVARGAVAADLPVDLDPATSTAGPTGHARFSYPSRVALADLLRLMLSISDNAAADALLDLVPPATVTARLASWGLGDVVVRHRVGGLYDAVAAVAEDPEVGLELAVRATTEGGGHAIDMLDVSRANCASPRVLADLLERVWSDEVGSPGVAARLRDLLGHQLTSRMQLAVGADTVTVRGKTGTFLNLRHEAAVVETDTGDRIAVVALTECEVVASRYVEADLAIGRAARVALEVLRE